MKTYRTKEILRIIPGLTQNQLVHWAEKGIVRPSYQDADGHGSVRLYIFKDLIKMVITLQLLQFGTGLSKVQGVFDWLEGNILIDGKPAEDYYVIGTSDKKHKDIWEALKKDIDSFHYFYMASVKPFDPLNKLLKLTWGFTNKIQSPGLSIGYIFFMNLKEIVSDLEKLTNERL